MLLSPLLSRSLAWVQLGFPSFLTPFQVSALLVHRSLLAKVNLRGRPSDSSHFPRNYMDLVQYFPCVKWYLISGSSGLTISPQGCADSAKQQVINCLLFRFLCFKNTVTHLHPAISVSPSVVPDKVCNLAR